MTRNFALFGNYSNRLHRRTVTRVTLFFESDTRNVLVCEDLLHHSSLFFRSDSKSERNRVIAIFVGHVYYRIFIIVNKILQYIVLIKRDARYCNFAIII